jgi:hypothetical protein
MWYVATYEDVSVNGGPVEVGSFPTQREARRALAERLGLPNLRGLKRVRTASGATGWFHPATGLVVYVTTRAEERYVLRLPAVWQAPR